MSFWLNNTAGQKSASLTFVTIGFLVVTLWLLVSIVARLGHVEIRQFDGTTAMQYLSPLLLLYFGRRYTDEKTTALDTDPTRVTVTAPSDVAVDVSTTSPVAST